MKKFNLVCLHGLCLDKGLFDELKFSECQLHAVNLPGHGGKSDSQVLSFLDMVDGIFQEIKHLENVVLLGHGLGGHIAYHLLPRLKVQGIFTISAPPVMEPNCFSRAYYPHPFANYFKHASFNEIQANEFARSMISQNQTAVRKVAGSILTSSAHIRNLVAASFTRGEFYNEVEILRKFQGKKIFLNPTKDNFTNETYLKGLHIAPVKDLHGAHALPLDNPQQLSDFLSLVLFGN